MSNYTKTTNFAAKDSLPSGNAAKIVKGTEIDTEFNNIETASATKADSNNSTLTGTTAFETLSDGSISITAFVDEDNMASDSATLLPTQQSVKAYVDSQVTAQDLDFQADTGGALSIDLDSETLTFTGGTGVDTSGSGNAVTFAIDSTVATLTGSQTLSNKTLSTPVVSGNLTTDGLIDGRDVATDGTKLDGIESGATADQTAAEIKTAYESNADTNAFTDADHSKLDGIEASADVTDTANVTAAGALMDSELTSEASVKAMNQGVATTDSPTFAGVTAPITGNVTGNLTGNVTGNVTGNLTGDVTGDVTGNVTGNLTGSVLTAAQTSITSVGTLGSLTVSGDVTVDTNSLKVDSTNNRVGILNASPDVTLDIGSATDSIHIPVGTTAQRPGSPAAGYFRYNSTLSQFEGYTDAWGAIGGGGGSNLVVDTMTGDGSDTTLTLSNDPLNENNTQVYIDGVYQNKDTYSVSGTTLTFSTAPPSGSAVEAMTIQPTAVNVPADASVTSAKLSGDLTLPGDLSFADNNKAIFGAGSDLQIYHDGSNSIINDGGTGDLEVQANRFVVQSASGGDDFLIVTPSAGVDLRHNDSGTVATKLATTSTGIDVTGTATMDGLTVSNASGGNVAAFTNTSSADLSINLTGGVSLITPSTGVLAFGTSNTERMRITSAGYVKIGNTGGSGILNVNNGANDGGYVHFANNVGSTTLTNDQGLAFGWNKSNGGGESIIIGNQGGGNVGGLVFATNTSGGSYAERMRIDSSGNVGINQTNPAAFNSLGGTQVVIGDGASGAENITFYSNTYGHVAFADSNVSSSTAQYAGLIQYYHPDDSMRLYTSSTERMRIDASGNVGIGVTSVDAKLKVQAASGNTTFNCFNAGSGSQTYIAFNVSGGGTSTGSITTNGSTTAYNTSSDYRLKENVVAMTGATERLKQLNPSRFNFIADADVTVDGFLAHEVQDIVPEAITGTKDAVDDDGNAVYQGIDQSKLVPLLVATIQELEARITELENN